MAKIARISSGIRNIVIAACGIFAVYALGVPAVQSYGEYQANRERVLTVPESVIRAEQEQAFRTLCPDYAAASTWERWTNRYFWKIGWCEDYIDRL